MSEAAGNVHAEPLRRFKPYPAYKPSGVDWLGEIPAHWEAKRLKNCVLRLESGGTPESDNFAYWSDDETGTPWVAISDMTRSFHVRETVKHLTERGLHSKRLPVLPAGTLLYSMYASLGKVALLETNAVVNQAILGFVTCDELVSRDHLRWWLEFMQGHVQLLSSSNTQDNLNADKVRKMPVFVPGMGGQRAIAAFLDRETARIDALVAKKERLLELLQEKRTALINRAVTKGLPVAADAQAGLDPTVPMKDSGVEWLGEIPAHWEVKRLRSTLTSCQNGVWGDEPDGIHDVVCVRVADFDRVRFGVDIAQPTLRSIDPQVVAARGLRPGDLLLEKSGGGEQQPVGAIVLYDHTVTAVCSNFIARVTIAEGHDVRFLTYLHAALYARRVNTRHIKQSTGIQNLDSAGYLGESTGLPPEPEQRAIAAFLDRETARIDALIAKVREAIERLKEYRTALISAAVTGKIDVRLPAASRDAAQAGEQRAT